MSTDCHPGCFVQEEDNADGAPVVSRHARTQPDFGGQEAGLKCSSIDEEESLSTPSGTTKRKKVVQATLVAIPFAKNNQHSRQQEDDEDFAVSKQVSRPEVSERFVRHISCA